MDILSVGQIASYKVRPGSKGLLVTIRDVQLAIDVEAVSQSLDREAWFPGGRFHVCLFLGGDPILHDMTHHTRFHIGDPALNDMSAWHAGRIHHRFRLLNPASSVVERLGSIAHLHWDARQHPSVQHFINCVTLRAARVVSCGHKRDEAIVRLTVELMKSARARRRLGGSDLEFLHTQPSTGLYFCQVDES